MLLPVNFIEGEGEMLKDTLGETTIVQLNRGRD
jgi:hypothetical protein